MFALYLNVIQFCIFNIIFQLISSIVVGRTSKNQNLKLKNKTKKNGNKRYIEKQICKGQKSHS
jgi:hypothetical protein